MENAGYLLQYVSFLTLAGRDKLILSNPSPTRERGNRG